MSSYTISMNSADNQQMSRRETINQLLRSASSFMTKKLACMIDLKSVDKKNQVASKTGGRLPKELKFKLFDVENELKMFTGMVKFVNGKKVVDISVLPFTSQKGSGVPGFSWSTIYNREFVSKKKVTDIAGNEVDVTVSSNSRFRSAGINTFLAQDVKRTLNPRGIKVMDISDKSKSRKTVYQITVFPLEENFKKYHPETGVLPVELPLEVATFALGHQPKTPQKVVESAAAPDAPVKVQQTKPVEDSMWVKAVKGTLSESSSESGESVAKSLESEFEEASNDDA